MNSIDNLYAKIKKILDILSNEYSDTIFIEKKDEDGYMILMDNRNLLNDNKFREYYFNLANEYLGDEGIEIVPVYDYMNEIDARVYDKTHMDVKEYENNIIAYVDLCDYATKVLPYYFYLTKNNEMLSNRTTIAKSYENNTAEEDRMNIDFIIANKVYCNN